MITAEELTIKTKKAAKSKLSNVNPEDLRFGRDFTDHMYIADYMDGTWKGHRIIPYGEIAMSPATSSLHYGQAIFEGMKAFKGKDGSIRLFRPMDNARRFNKSAVRMCMPEFPQDQFVYAIRELIGLDRDWVPEMEGHSLYIRPFMFADEVFLGVKPSSRYKFMVICSPASSYYPEPIRVKIETRFSRAVLGGTGMAKAAGNYAAALYPAKLASEEGYHQLIWTDCVEHKNIEEAGTMNIMFAIGDVLITPALDTGTILEGITRDSIIKIAQDQGYTVEERPVSVEEIFNAYEKGILTDAFGMGTAANIAPIKSIGTEMGEIVLPEASDRNISIELSSILSKIKYGEINDTFGWTEEV